MLRASTWAFASRPFIWEVNDCEYLSASAPLKCLLILLYVPSKASACASACNVLIISFSATYLAAAAFLSVVIFKTLAWAPFTKYFVLFAVSIATSSLK